MEITGPEAHVYASRRCIFEPNFALGDEVREGEIAGWQHDLDAEDVPRVIRGGGWLDQPVMCRATRRGSDQPTWADPAVGFRCAKSR